MIGFHFTERGAFCCASRLAVRTAIAETAPRKFCRQIRDMTGNDGQGSARLGVLRERGEKPPGVRMTGISHQIAS